MTPSRSASLNTLIAPGWAAVVHNWKPFVLIQAAGALLVLAYYQSPALQQATIGLQNLKASGGLIFVMLTTAFSGVILPEFAKLITMPNEPRPTLRDWVFRLSFFAVLGLEVDTLYRLLGWWLGTDVTLRLVVTKVLLDMFGFSVLVSIPMSATGFYWRDVDFNWSKTVAGLSNGGFAKLYWPLMITCWAFWIPVLACVYSMPKNMQFVLFICANAAWSLLLVTMGTSKKK